MRDIYCHTSSLPPTLEELERFTAHVNEAVKAASTLPDAERCEVRNYWLLEHNKVYEAYTQAKAN